MSFGIALSAILVILSVIGLLIVRKFVKVANFKSHHDVADPLLSVVGTLFAVLLGFMIANSMQRFQDAQTTTQQEANALMDMYRLAQGMPDAKKKQLQADIGSYVDAVIVDEWPKLDTCRASSRAWRCYGDIWDDCIKMQPDGSLEGNLHAKILDSLTVFGDSRRQRMEELHRGLPAVLWIVLIAGGVTTIIFTYLFNVENVRVQVVMTTFVSLAICLNLFLLHAFDDPFSGEVAVKPYPFIIDQRSFAQMAHPERDLMVE